MPNKTLGLRWRNATNVSDKFSKIDFEFGVFCVGLNRYRFQTSKFMVDGMVPVGSAASATFAIPAKFGSHFCGVMLSHVVKL